MAQFNKLEEFISVKRDIYARDVTDLLGYFEFLPELPSAFLRRSLSEGLLKEAAINGLELIHFLANKNIETR